MSSTRSSITATKAAPVDDEIIIERLLQGAYHLPGNSYWQDLWQYFGNTHPLFGICCHHPLHPIGWGLRTCFLFGSVAFGLAVTNVIYVAFVIDNSKYDATYYSASYNHTLTGNQAIDSQLTQITVTNGMIVLWTVGGVMNAMYDVTIWTIASCKCFRSGTPGKDRLRFYILMLILLTVVTGSTLAVLVRATFDSNQQTAEVANKLELKYTPNAESYRFLISYAVEVALSLLVWYFLVGFVMFTGVLGCGGKVPILGGRPYELKKLDEMTRQSQKSMSNGAV